MVLVSFYILSKMFDFCVMDFAGAEEDRLGLRRRKRGLDGADIPDSLRRRMPRSWVRLKIKKTSSCCFSLMISYCLEQTSQLFLLFFTCRVIPKALMPLEVNFYSF